jgi:predicted nucleotidyltransferase
MPVNIRYVHTKFILVRLQIPKLGIKMPIMGTLKQTAVSRKTATGKWVSAGAGKRTSLSTRETHASRSTAIESGIATALFSATQQRVLGLLFGQPDRSFFANEIIALAGAGSGATQRELAKLELALLVKTSRVGNQKHYQANADSPIYAELASIIAKTVGIVEPLRVALAPLAKKIQVAFVYGSIAKKSDTAKSDIDIMVIADSLSYADVYAALEIAETKLARAISPTVQSLAEWRKKRAGKNAFTIKVITQPKFFLIGDEAMLE